MSDSTLFTYPRSAYDRTGGLLYFARMLDKIRLHAAGRLPPDYHANLGGGLDGRCSRFVGVPYEELRDRTLADGSDDAVLEWAFSRGRRPTEEEIYIWNCFARKRGWRDDDEGMGAALEKYKADSGLGHRKDIVTAFDFYEADEKREPAGAAAPRVTAVAPVLLVSDVQKSAAYFRDALGFSFDRFWGEPPNFCMPRRNGLTVMLSEVPRGSAVVPPWHVVDKMWSAYFWVDDAAALFEEFKQRGALIDYGLGMKPYDVLEFGVQDPDGNDIGFGQVMPPGSGRLCGG